jgi:hypothetical protein
MSKRVVQIYMQNSDSNDVISDGIHIFQWSTEELSIATYRRQTLAVHLAGSENRIADFLSRWHLSNEFKDKFYTSVDCNLHEYIAEDLFLKFIHDRWQL